MKIQEFICQHCQGTFQKNASRVRRALRLGRPTYCSVQCAGLAKVTATTAPCSHCGAPVTRPKNAENVSGKRFCSRGCSASARNCGRSLPDGVRSKISSSVRSYHDRLVPKPRSSCSICGKDYLFKPGRVSCSRVCHAILTTGRPPYSAPEVLDAIQRVYNDTGSVPGIRDNPPLFRAAQKFFGSWNSALFQVGITPNPKCFGRRNIRCIDGHRADSLSERLIDDWLHQRWIQHERSRPYPYGKYTCDFYLPATNTWVEYFGLVGTGSRYQETIERKQEIMQEFGMNLVCVYPNDIYPTRMLDFILSDSSILSLKR